MNGNREKLRKEVTVVAYANDGHKNSEEDFVAAATGEPCNETETEGKVEYKLELEGLREEIVKELANDDYFKDGWEEFYQSASRSNVKRMNVSKREFSKNRPKITMNRACRNLRENLRDDVPESISGELALREWGIGYNNEEKDNKVKVLNKGQDKMKILSKEEKRTDDNLYESLTKRPCIKYKILMEAYGGYEETPSDLIEMWSEEVIPPFTKALHSLDGVGRVRYMSCTKVSEQQGECYNI